MSRLPEASNVSPPFALMDLADISHDFGQTFNHRAYLLFFVKKDCETCTLVAPIVEQIHQNLSAHGLQVLTISQSSKIDTQAFIKDTGITTTILLDQDLYVSADYGFDAVPTFVLTDNTGTILKTFEGWSQSSFNELLEKSVKLCSTKLTQFERNMPVIPDWLPGCASRANDPDIARRLAVRRGDARLAARRIRIPAETEKDEFEFLFNRGLTDGLPVVPPTEKRVLKMLDGISRPATDVVARVPPNLSPVTVEKIAINAVMAGCRPEYLPVVIAAVEAVCTDTFNLHGVLATTYFVGPIIVVNGPIRHDINLNCGQNLFGQGARANATIGRALQLIVRNIGGGKPGEVDMSTFGQPGKFTCCIGELEERSAWEPLHVERGFKVEQNTVTVFAGEAPRAIRDQRSRSANSLATSLGLSLESVAHVKLHGMGEVLLVVSPEHNHTFGRGGYTKDILRERIQEVTSRPLRELLPDRNCEKGTPLSVLPKEWKTSDGSVTEDALSQPFPKFLDPKDILIIVAGGEAGKFSAVVGGWAAGGLGSIAVTREVQF
tara:strand:+ start:16870 stop:18516 length:1647 start_codon:yes stop_codon:yes gene_type:complete